MSDYVIALYEVEAKNIEDAAHAIAYGQSIGNPSIRTKYDNKLLHLVPKYEIDGKLITMFFPLINFGKNPSLNYMMSVLMGGQMDIADIYSCKLLDLDVGSMNGRFMGPAYGVSRIRELVDAPKRPLVGGIVKPKIGLNPKQLADIVLQMADGGADFIKEDEIMANQEWCPFNDRIEEVMKALAGYRTIYAPCCTYDDFIFPHARVFAIHINWWCGFGYIDIMRRHVPYKPAIFFQRSGIQVITDGPFSISFGVIYKMVNLIGCDFAHVGMFGGYGRETEEEMRSNLSALKNTIPSFSCGATPSDVGKLVDKFGQDIMISSGGCICGHEKGPEQGVREFRREADKYV